jgi:GTP-binding protein HflX
VGYTNAGKSSLFNTLTESEVYAADQLFATLDPTLRKIDLASVGRVILADTVGFIRHLPHDLVAAFKATLTETREAELLLHVVDIADERRSENIEQVEYVLKEIEASDVPQLIVCNKIDKLDDIEPRIDRDEQGLPIRVWLSAQANVGIELLYKALAERLDIEVVNHYLTIPPNEGKLRGELYKLNCITSEQFDDKGNCLIEINLPSRDWQRLLANDGNNLENYIQN